MKKLLFTLVFLFGAFTMMNAQTNLRISLPNGEQRTFQINEEDVRFPCCNEIVNYQAEGESSQRWSFPVNWWIVDFSSGQVLDSGSFIMSGNATNMCGIITSLENLFGLNIGGC